MGLSLWDCLVCCIAIMVKRLKNLIQIEVASIEAGNLSVCNPLIPFQDNLYILRIQLNVKTQPSCLFRCYQRCSTTGEWLYDKLSFSTRIEDCTLYEFYWLLRRMFIVLDWMAFLSSYRSEAFSFRFFCSLDRLQNLFIAFFISFGVISHGLLINLASVSWDFLPFLFCIEKGFMLALIRGSDMVDTGLIPNELRNDLKPCSHHCLFKSHLRPASMEDIHWSRLFRGCSNRIEKIS